ncbi:unnamed protein product [Medioppia subpectinata]|uniref:Malonyl-CoA:ACP transacylase (MAT) domain-containing protein n=1 Tax=Medioppia subpectinata TaxID=1979941 RepID=A0A7R9KXL3_9ACAR|nr:unnamed protein product [Medioppia subpectinata]CAG2110452.1 unnamed protein product [Medioppia subpectinata]
MISSDCNDQAQLELTLVSARCERDVCDFIALTRNREFVGDYIQSMMSVQAFRESWSESAKIVAPLGVNLMDCINGYRFKFGDKPFGGVGCIPCLAYQFAIVDTLRSLGVTPDGYFGHSLGEVMCAYMDGWADKGQCLLAYIAAQLSATDKYQDGMLLQAATDCTWSELTARCERWPPTPAGRPTLYPSHHLNVRRTHVTGYEAPVRALIDELNAQGQMAKPLWLAPYSVHTGSAFMANTYDTLLKQFERVVPDPQRRRHSARWLTSVPPTSGGPSLSSPPEYTFAEFMALMVWSPVDVKSAVDRLPADALVIDISGQRDLRHVVLKDRPQAIYIGCTRVGPTIANQSVAANGSSSGIGEAIAIKLWSLGANVVITGGDEKRIAEVVNKSFTPSSKMMLHCMAKCALDMFTKCLALQLGPKGIRVNSVNPATIRTPIFERITGDTKLLDQLVIHCRQTYPLGRIGEPEEVAEAVAFLANESSASFITGLIMTVNGGANHLPN